MSKKVLLIIILIILLLIAIPATIYVVQTQQESRGRATASTTLAMSPTTVTKNIDDDIALDVNIDPGNNLVSFVSLDITYDPTKVEPSGTNALEINKAALPIVLQGPVYSTGRIRINLSTGNDPTSAIDEPTKVGTLTMKAIGGTSGSTTSIAFGANTQILSVAGPSTGSNDSAGENVLSTSTPALITIAGDTPNLASNSVEEETSAENVPSSPSTQSNAATQASRAQSNAAVISPTVTTQPTITQSAPTPTSTPALIAQVLTITPTRTPTISPTITNTPTPTKIPGSVNDASTFITNTPTPTIAATGPNFNFLGVGILLVIFLIGGTLLLITL